MTRRKKLKLIKFDPEKQLELKFMREIDRQLHELERKGKARSFTDLITGEIVWLFTETGLRKSHQTKPN